MPQIPRKNWVALVVVGAGVGGFFLWRSSGRTEPPPIQPLPPKTIEAFENRSAPLKSDWDSAVMTAMSDQAALREGFAELVNSTPVPMEMNISKAQCDALVDCLTTFFFAWFSDNAEDYLSRIQEYRMPIAQAIDGQAVESTYFFLTGRQLPLEKQTAEVLREFWQGRAEAPSRPIAMSLVSPTAVIDFKEHNPHGGPRSSSRYSRLDEATESRWIGPMGQALVQLTVPKNRIEDVRTENAPWMEEAFVGTVVECGSGERFPLYVKCFWSPQASKWQMRAIGVVTPVEVVWPY